MALRLLAPRPVRGNVAFWFGVLLCAGSCKISQTSDFPPDACAIGDLCGDAGDSEGLSTAAVAPTTTPPAETSRADASPPEDGVCPGECLPDDLEAKECAEPVVLDLELIAQVAADGGVPSESLDASLSASEAGGALDSSLSGIHDADTELDADTLDGSIDGARTDSSTHPGDNASRPIDVVDPAASGNNNGAKVPLSCQLVSVKGAVKAGCAPSGPGVEGSVCTSARDCAAGFGCVGEVGAGQCLPYCCGGNDTCAVDRYCDSRPMRSQEFGEQSTAIPQIPVCVAAEQCSLDVATEDEQPDAQEDGPTSCPAGTACSIVRANTTACQPTGAGKEGDDCPCGGGYFCSKVTNSCLKLCNTTAPTSCGQRECQPGPSGFPAGWGLCVGG